MVGTRIFAVILRAYAYILTLGREGLRRVSETAVLNANYALHALKDVFSPAAEGRCMHEFVLSAARQAEHGVRALDIAKMLIDRGFHPPTVYFPAIVKECLMIEPTETESRETLDAFIAAMRDIARLAEQDPDACRRAPEHAPVGRLDEVAAAKEMNFSGKDGE
jgi:glycine dehydrogenase subunit 2